MAGANGGQVWRRSITANSSKCPLALVTAKIMMGSWCNMGYPAPVPGHSAARLGPAAVDTPMASIIGDRLHSRAFRDEDVPGRGVRNRLAL